MSERDRSKRKSARPPAGREASSDVAGEPSAAEATGPDAVLSDAKGEPGGKKKRPPRSGRAKEKPARSEREAARAPARDAAPERVQEVLARDLEQAAGGLDEPLGRQVDAKRGGEGATVAPPSRLGRARKPGATPGTGEAQASFSASTQVDVRESGEAGLEEDVWSEGLAAGASLEAELEESEPAAVASERESAAPAARLTRGSSPDRVREAAAFGSSQSLLSTDYYFRQYGAHGMRSLAAEIDDFGFDPHVDEKVRPLLEAVCRRYFRVGLVGAEHVPATGPALLVANRSGALPWDGLVLRTALRAGRPALEPLRWLSEDSVFHYPFMGVFMNRLGAVRACPENAERLLVQNRLVAVFPEGAQGSRKLFRDRYRLQRFGRGGYVKLALKLGVPILPTAIIGAEETNPVLGRSRFLGRIVGSESVPITPTFPLLGLAGLLPAPVRWRITIGPPVDLSRYGAESADDALVVHRLNEQIRSSLQALVDKGKSERGGTFFA